MESGGGRKEKDFINRNYRHFGTSLSTVHVREPEILLEAFFALTASLL